MICNTLQKGSALSTVVAAVESSSDFGTVKSREFVDIAVNAYCPQYSQ